MVFQLPFFTSLRSTKKNKIKKRFSLIPWVDILALFAWGALLLKYVVTGQIKLLIHPNYIVLVLITSIFFFVLASFRVLQLRRSTLSNNLGEHITLFSPRLSSFLLLTVAILGLLIPPKILSSQAALQIGVSDNLPLTRFQPESFRTATLPEDRSLFDWVRTLNVYPEPDAYVGQKANVKGFVLHLPELPDDYLFLARFVVTCCAVDAYPIGLPVKLENSRDSYAQDLWLSIQGTMTTVTLPVIGNSSKTDEKERRLVLVAKSIEEIPIPSDPYDY